MDDVARRLRILGALAWPSGVKQEFLASQGRELPRVSYPDRRAALDEVARLALEGAACHTGSDPIDRWLRETFGSYAAAARMMAAVGTPEFTRCSTELYGDPGAPVGDGGATNLDLARHVLAAGEMMGASGAPATRDEERLAAPDAMRVLEQRLRSVFPGERVCVVLSRSLAAKAIAGTRKVRLQRDACYSRQELEVLVVHEGRVHMATALNGERQPVLPCLGKGSPRTTATQEGLAVFAELMAGVADLRRLCALGERVVAVDMAQRGADFLEVYRYFLERGRSEEESFHSAHRVFRGGRITGGAPFTKDVVYLPGAARVRSFFDAALARGTLADAHRLFAGKVDLIDLEALRELDAAGWLAPARYVPPWVQDTGLLAASLCFGSFSRCLDPKPLEPRVRRLRDSSRRRHTASREPASHH